MQLHLETLLFLPFLIESISAFTISPWILPVIEPAYHSQDAKTTRLHFNHEDYSEALEPFLQVPTPDYFDGSIEDYEFKIAGKDEQSDIENISQILVEKVAESIDVAIEISRLDSYSPYINVSSSAATSSIAICVMVDGLSNLSIQDYLFHYADVVTATLCTLAGIYSTVVFPMCSSVSFLPFMLLPTIIYFVSYDHNN